MRIEVTIAGWEQDCCGSPFRVGEQMTWNLHAADPAAVPEGALPRFVRFVEEHHEGEPREVPECEVTGAVASIKGINFPLLPVAGERHFTMDTDHPQSFPTASVGYPKDPGFDEVSVILNVADDVDLPLYSPEGGSSQRANEAQRAARNQERLHDSVGALLENLADHAQRQYGNMARITRSSKRSAATLEPYNAGSTAFYWARSDHAEDGIVVFVGDGTWALSASLSDAELVSEFLEAAAAGRVEERIRHNNRKIKRLATEITTADGRLWADTTEFETFDTGNGKIGMVGISWERFEKGDHKYQPWGK